MRQRRRAREDFILHENAMKRQNQTHNAMSDKLTSEKMAWDAERKRLLAELAKYNAKSNEE